VALSPIDAAHERLSPAERRHLRALVGEWGMLADLCFSDLVLYLPLDGGESFVIAGHVRPATGQTIYHAELVGEVRSAAQRPLVAAAYATGHSARDSVDSPMAGEQVSVTALPVRHDGRVVAVLAREEAVSQRREPGELESTYRRLFAAFSQMIETGSFPYPSEDEPLPDAPRVGDGVLVAGADGLVEYASPNATSALTRAGVTGNLRDRPLVELKVGQGIVREALASRRSLSSEIEPAPEVVLSVRLFPLWRAASDGSGLEQPAGLVLLLRDVTDLRRRDRLLLSKDATIREIHHRVKNNLQTISSLLRLQGRRLREPTAKTAVEESVRRIRSIAVVHEILSRDAGDDVDFDEVVRPLVHMVEEGLVSDDRPVRFHVEGHAPTVASPTATALAVVLTELLQNVVEHAVPDAGDGGPGTDGGAPGHVEVSVELGGSAQELTLSVTDDGTGLPDGFDPLTTSNLGLSIVHGLVTSELGGTIAFERARDDAHRPGTRVAMRVPLSPSAGAP